MCLNLICFININVPILFKLNITVIMTNDDIKKRLIETFPNGFIEVSDMNAKSDHFSIMVISNDFKNMSLIDRHKMIYKIFEKELTKEIHAMQINTYTLPEWKTKES